MKIAKNTFDEFHQIASKKEIIAFAVTDFLKLICMNYKELKLSQYISIVVDNDVNKQSGSVLLNGCEKYIKSPDKLLEYNENTFAILITSDTYAVEIYKQLEEMLPGKNIEVFFLSLMIAKHVDDTMDNSLIFIPKKAERKIPKVIHYFWFSKEEKTGLVTACIESWKKACPEYELKEWNGDNYDVTVNPFTAKAFQHQKWAFVSDYARLDVIHKYGGIYLDLDVILYKSLDLLLHNVFFVGFGPIRDIEAAVFGAKPDCPILGEMLEIYNNREFDLDKGTTLLNVQPVLLDRFFEKKGFEINGRFQERDGVAIYPRDLFSAKNWFTGVHEVTDTAIGVHECAGGWVSKDGKTSRQIKKECNQKLEDIYRKAWGDVDE